MPPVSSRARGSVTRAAARLAGSRASASRICASIFGPTRAPRAAGPPRPPRGTPPACAPERPRDLDRAPRGQPEVAAEADQPGRELALELGQLGDLPRLDELAQPRLDPGPDPAQLPHPPRAHEPSTGTAAPRISSAARRYARIVYGFASASSSSEANASRRSAMAALSTGAVCRTYDPAAWPSLDGAPRVRPARAGRAARRPDADVRGALQPQRAFRSTTLTHLRARALGLGRARRRCSPSTRRCSTTWSTPATARTGPRWRASSTGSRPAADPGRYAARGRR